MSNDLFNLILSLLMLVIATGGGYIVKLFKENLEGSKFASYFDIAKQVVMSIEQLYPSLANEDKKKEAVALLLKLTNNKLTEEQANTLIEAAVFEVKKLLNNNLN